MSKRDPRRLPHDFHLWTAVASTVDPLRRKGRKKEVRGEIPYLGNRPVGCPFHTRCKYAEDRCRTDRPALRKINGTAQEAACHFAEKLDLKGAYDDAPQKEFA